MAGGLRAGATRAIAGVVADSGRRPGGTERARRRLLGGPHPRRRRRATRSNGARREGYPLRGSPGSTPPAGRSRRASSTPTPISSSPAPRARAGAAAAGCGLPGDPRRGRRHPLDRRRDPRGDRDGLPRTAGAGSTRCSATGRRRSRRSPATASTCRRSCGSLEVAYRLGKRVRSRSCRRSSGPTRSRPSSATARTRTRRTSARSSTSSCPGVAAQGRARHCDVFCEKGVFTADQSRRILEAAARLRAAPAAPRRRAGTVAAARSSRPRSGRRRRPPRDALRCRHRCPGAGGSRRRPVVATLLPGDDLVPDEGPPRAGPGVHRRGVPVALGTDFNPGTSPTPILPLVMSLACLEPEDVAGRGARGGRRSTQRTRSAWARSSARSRRGKQADLAIWRVPTSARSLLAGARTSCGPW